MAIADMSDGTLKVKAFEVILANLLGQQEGTSVLSINTHHSKTQMETTSAKKARSTKERILVLKRGGFFQKPKAIRDVKEGLESRGWIYATTALSGPLQELVQAGELRRIKEKGWKYVNP